MCSSLTRNLSSQVPAFLAPRLTSGSSENARRGIVAPHPTPVTATVTATPTGVPSQTAPGSRDSVGDGSRRAGDAADARAIPVNPFDASATTARLAAAFPTLVFDRGVHVHPGPGIVQELLEATRRARAARARPRGGVPLVLGDASYLLMGATGAGADAEVFEAERVDEADVVMADADADTDTDAAEEDKRGGFAIKVQSARLAAWEWIVSGRLNDRLSAWDAPAVVQPLALHLVGGDDARAANVGVVVMPFGEHGTLQDVLNSYLRVGKHMDETLVMYYAVELLRLVENVHAAGVLHADVKPDNLLVRNGGDDWCDWAAHRPGSWKQKGLALIDLGRAVDLAEFPPDAVFVGDVNTEGFRCAEMIEGRPWTFQCDAHQVAATVYALLYGRYMTVDRRGDGYRQREPLRRYWRTDLWEAFFSTLLNVPTRAIHDPPPLGNLRRLFEARLTSERLGGRLRLGLMRQTIDMYEQIREGKAV